MTDEFTKIEDRQSFAKSEVSSPEPCAKGFESALNWFKDNNTSHVDNHPLKTEKREVNDVLNILKDLCNPPSRTYGCLILTRPLPRYLRTAVMFLTRSNDSHRCGIQAWVVGGPFESAVTQTEAIGVRASYEARFYELELSTE